MEAPFIDWNGNGMIDPSDIAISLAMQSEEDDKQQEEDTQVRKQGDK